MLTLMGSGVIREFDAMSGILARNTATSFGVGLHLDPASRRAFLAGIGSDGLRAFHSYMGDARECEAIYEQVDRALAETFGAMPGSLGVEFTITVDPGVMPSLGMHVCFRAPDRGAVLTFHAAALAAGGQDDGAPGLYTQYHAHYFAAFVLDPDGHRVEVVCHAPEMPSTEMS